MKNLKFQRKHFFTSVKSKPRKQGKIWLKRVLFMSYGCLTDVLRMSYDSILIIQMLKFRQKRDMKRPDFRKNDVYTSFTDVLRWSYGGLTVVL